MEKALVSQSQFFVHQKREMAEALTGIETRNRYEVYDAKGSKVGGIEEESSGMGALLSRMIFKSHRPLNVKVFNTRKEISFYFTRTFFFFFSDMIVKSTVGQKIGSVHRRFALLSKKYDLTDERGQVFARIQAPIWRIWKFPIVSREGVSIGEITKKWRKGKTGVLTEMFTDADTFLIDYGRGHWTPQQRLVILATAISIDFDFFEDNVKGIGLLRS